MSGLSPTVWSASGLATCLREHVAPRHQVVAAATVAGGEITTTSVGAPPGADFEIGSVSKGVTGLLYADALARGEVGPTTVLGDLLAMGDSPAARVALSDLSTHTSGLPRLPPGALTFRRSLDVWRNGTNPYGEDLDELLAQAAASRVGRRRASYSNLGFELLGHALAAAAGSTYRELLDARVARPLGMASLYAPTSAEELRPGALRGTSRSGRTQDAWTGEALAPAGGIRASIEDMGRFALALLDGSAPGTAALDPVRTFAGPGVRIGAAWITVERRGRPVTWHNGATGGFRSWLGVDRAAGTGVVLLSATARSVDRAGMALLDEITRPAG